MALPSEDPERNPKDDALAELKKQLKMAWPLVVTHVSQVTFCIEPLMFSGHLGKKELDAVALATSLVNVLGVSILWGLASSCETLFAQIYGSANKKLVGVVLIRALVILLLICLPCIALYCNIGNLLILMGQDPVIAGITAEYLDLFIPGLLAMTVYIVISRYLQNQNIVYPTMIAGLVANGANILMQYCFVYLLQMGPRGSAMALALSFILLALLNLAYLLLSRVYTETWGGWSWEFLEDWGPFCNLAFTGLVMVCVEFWTFEAGVILSGIKGDTELGANAIVIQLELFVIMVPKGIAVACSIRVGQQLGAGSAGGAKTAAGVSLAVGASIGIVYGILYWSLRWYLPRIFTEDNDVIELAASALQYVAVICVFDGITSVGSGILRGLGRQALGAGIALAGYPFALVVGVPCLFMTRLSVAGLWLGLALACSIQTVFISVVVYRQDWDEAVAKAKLRAKEADFLAADSEKPHEEERSEKTPLFNGGEDSSRTDCCCGLYMRRASVVTLCVALLANGVACRFMFPPPSIDAVTDIKETLPRNTTISFLGTI